MFFLFDQVACLKVDFPEQRFEFQSLNDLVFRTKLILLELYVVLEDFVRVSFKVRNSLIKGFHETVNFVM